MANPLVTSGGMGRTDARRMKLVARGGGAGAAGRVVGPGRRAPDRPCGSWASCFDASITAESCMA